MAERSKALDWNSSNIFTGVRGFESHSLRHLKKSQSNQLHNYFGGRGAHLEPDFRTLAIIGHLVQVGDFLGEIATTLTAAGHL